MPGIFCEVLGVAYTCGAIFQPNGTVPARIPGVWIYVNGPAHAPHIIKPELLEIVPDLLDLMPQPLKLHSDLSNELGVMVYVPTDQEPPRILKSSGIPLGLEEM